MHTIEPAKESIINSSKSTSFHNWVIVVQYPYSRSLDAHVLAEQRAASNTAAIRSPGASASADVGIDSSAVPMDGQTKHHYCLHHSTVS